MPWLVEKAVELGVTGGSLDHCAGRGACLRVARPASGTRCYRGVKTVRSEPADERRSGRTAWHEFVRTVSSSADSWIAHPGEVRRAVGASLCAHPGAGEPPLRCSDPKAVSRRRKSSPAFESGWQPIRLGPRILRIETAALALAALMTLDAARWQLGSDG